MPGLHNTLQCSAKQFSLVLPSVKLSLPNFSCVPPVLTHSRKSLQHLSSKFPPSSTETKAWGNSRTTSKTKTKNPNQNKTKTKQKQQKTTTKEAWQVVSPKKRRDWLPNAPDPGEIH